MQFITDDQRTNCLAQGNVVQLANDADPLSLADQLAHIRCIELNFPKFTDGRAFSQAYLLRRRMGYQGAIRATGEVLIDQVLQMQRSGFDQVVLVEGQSAEHAAKLLAHYGDEFYQGDAVQVKPFFTKEAA